MRIIIIILLLTFINEGCSQQEDSLKIKRKPLEQVFIEYHDSLLSLPNVKGFYQGMATDGSELIVILVDSLSEENKNIYPEMLEGYPVKIEVTDEIKPMNDSLP